MDRQEFLVQLWRKFLRPAFLLIVLVVVAQFLFNVLTNDGTERQLVYVFIGLTVILTIFFILRITLDFISVWFKYGISFMPANFQRIVRTTSRTLNYLGLLGLLVLTVLMYLNENFYGMLLPALYLLTHLKRLLTSKSDLVENRDLSSPRL